jgi:hypothetical protein
MTNAASRRSTQTYTSNGPNASTPYDEAPRQSWNSPDHASTGCSTNETDCAHWCPIHRRHYPVTNMVTWCKTRDRQNHS